MAITTYNYQDPNVRSRRYWLDGQTSRNLISFGIRDAVLRTNFYCVAETSEHNKQVYGHA